MNYLARLGWAHKDQEIFALEELIEKFDLPNVGKSPSIFDADKLGWLNSHYMKTLPEGEMAKRLEPFLRQMGIEAIDRQQLVKIVVSLRERAKTLKEMAQMAEFFFQDNLNFDEAARSKFLSVATKPFLIDFLEGFRALPDADEGLLKAFIEKLTEKYNTKPVNIIQPIRVALCGRTVSPGIFEVVNILGKEKVENRIAKAIESIQ